MTSRGKRGKKASSRRSTADTLRGGGPRSSKLQRWIDLIAALLARSLPASFEDLAKSVPDYAGKLRAAERERDERRKRALEASVKRAFERDKDELRCFGVPIESLADGIGNASGAYRLRRTDFYLPYLCFATRHRGVQRPARVDRWGYQALTSISFDADELQAVIDAAAAVRELGNPLLTADVATALRKLAADLPIDSATISAEEPRVVLPRSRASRATFEVLGEALMRSKRASFVYHAMSTDRTETREVEPYGLFFINGHWYLAGRDCRRGELRNFRLNRISRVRVNSTKAQTPDYAIPPIFRLRDHAQSREAWELGDGDTVSAIVEIEGESGPALAAARIGALVPGAPSKRVFRVRRVDRFVRWLLAFAGELRPVSPPEVVSRFAEEAAAIARIYADTSERRPVQLCAAGARASTLEMHRPNLVESETWEPDDAAAQLRRVLLVVPQIADGEEHSLSTIATRAGTTIDVLRRDLYSLVARFDTPAGFVDGLQIYLEPHRVSAVSNHFARPMRLTVSELCALELGLAVLQARRPPDEHSVFESARTRLRKTIAKLPSDSSGDFFDVQLTGHGDTKQLASVRTALRTRRKLRLVYRRSGSSKSSERVVCPFAIVASSGMFYLIAGCDSSGFRVFRMDRVEGAECTNEQFEVPANFSIDALIRDGRVFQNDRSEALVVRYSPALARWIAEREGLVAAGGRSARGSLFANRRVHEWPLNHGSGSSRHLETRSGVAGALTDHA